jgi:hypothetical protein
LDLIAFVPSTDLPRSVGFYGCVLGLVHVETTPLLNGSSSVATSFGHRIRKAL